VGESKVDLMLIYDTPNGGQPACEGIKDLGKEFVAVAAFLCERNLGVACELVEEPVDLFSLRLEIKFGRVLVLCIETRSGGQDYGDEIRR